jgi:hypothetical protein
LNLDFKRYFKKYFLPCLLVFEFSNADAQFTGGNHSGFGLITVSCPVTVNISAGGSNDGFAIKNISCPMMVNIFTGGSNDGFVFIKTSCARTVFSGGSSDGFAYAGKACIGIFSGGPYDGFTANIISCPVSVAIFSGGTSDGFSSSALSCSVSSQIFTGGISDGSGFISITCPLSSNVFTGGSYQGFAFNPITCVSTTNVFTGGFYDGFALNNISCPASINISFGGSFQGFSRSKVACSSTIYSGGSNDGFSKSSLICSGIFFGGALQGFAFSGITCAVQQNVSKGGSYDGFTENILSCISSVNIFAGFSFDGFSISRIGCSPGGGNSLPVGLIYLKASCENNKVSVNWKTASETNNNYFTVERSSDGINFRIMGIVQGAGTSSQAINYSFVDAEPLNSTAFYRLEQTDFDGQSEYLDMVASTCMEHEGMLSIYPNPNNGHFIIDGAPMNASLVITSLVGEKVYDDKIWLKKTEIVLPDQPNGIYFIQLNTGQEIITKKISIVH